MSKQYTPAEMAQAILNIGQVALQEKNVTPLTIQQVVEPDTGKAGLSSVTVEPISPIKTSADLTATGDTVTVPAGWYGQNATKSVQSGTASTPSTSIAVTPSISVSSNGLITASVSDSESIAPTVSAGYITNGTAGTISISGSDTVQLTTKDAQTYTPSTTNQTILSNQYLIGTQTILGDTNLVSSNIKNGASIFGVNGDPNVVDTSSGDATSSDIVLEKKAWVDGVEITGSLVKNTSTDITVSGPSVTVPAGVYESNVTKAVASGAVTIPTTYVTANPSISVNNIGLVSASIITSEIIEPMVSAGYVSSVASGTVTITGSSSNQLSTQVAETYTPTNAEQTIISAGKYTTGDQKIEAVICSNLTAENIKKDVIIKVGTATDDDSITMVTGTYEDSGGYTKPSYLISDSDTVNVFYFNKEYSNIDTFLASLTYSNLDPNTGLYVCMLGFSNPLSVGLNHLFAVDLTGGEYAIVWNDGTTVTPIYTSIAVPTFDVTTAGWQVGSFTPDSSITVDEDYINASFLAIMDNVVAKDGIAFGDHGGSGKDHTFEIPTISGTYTYTGSSKTPTITGYYSDFMTKTGDTSAINAGSYSITFTLTDTTNCQWRDGTTTPKSVSWSIVKATPAKPSLSRPSVIMRTGFATATFTVTRSGDGVISAVSSNPAKISASVSGNTVTVTALDTGEALTASITVTVAEGTNYTAYTETDVVCTATVQTGYITATVAGLGSSSPSSVTFTKDTGFTAAGLGIIEVTMDGDTFISIPTMYRKVNTVEDDQITSFTIANGPVDNTYEPYPAFVAEDGVTVLPYILIGKYSTSSTSKMESVSNNANDWKTLTIANARTYARNRGTGYQQLDWQFMRVWQDLLITLMSTIDTNPGTTQTDVLGIYWATKSNHVDGIWHYNRAYLFSYKPSKYASSPTTSTTGYSSVSYSVPTSSGNIEIQKLGYDQNAPFVNFPSAVTSNNSYNTYYCDGFLGTSGTTGSYAITATFSLGAASYKQFGAFYINASNAYNTLQCARLCYRPVSA